MKNIWVYTNIYVICIIAHGKDVVNRKLAASFFICSSKDLLELYDLQRKCRVVLISVPISNMPVVLLPQALYYENYVLNILHITPVFGTKVLGSLRMLNPKSNTYIAPSGPNATSASRSNPPPKVKEAGKPVLFIAKVLTVLVFISIWDILCPIPEYDIASLSFTATLLPNSAI